MLAHKKPIIGVMEEEIPVSFYQMPNYLRVLIADKKRVFPYEESCDPFIAAQLPNSKQPSTLN